MILWALTAHQMPVLRLYKGTYKLGGNFHDSVCYFESTFLFIVKRVSVFYFCPAVNLFEIFPTILCIVFFFLMWNCVDRIFFTKLWQYFVHDMYFARVL